LRQGALYGGAVLLGFALGTGALMALRTASPADGNAALQSAITPVASCSFEPLLQPAARADAQFNAPAEVTDKTVLDVAAYVSVANDAATQGRIRDAEVAFITACRIAGHLLGAPSLELADTRYQLARHYTTVAAAGPAGDSQRSEVLRRAETLFNESMEGYTARLGPPHEKTRLAAAGLTLARQAASLAGQLQGAVAAATESTAAATLLAQGVRRPASPASAVPMASARSRASRSATASPADADTSVMGAAPTPVKKKPKPKPETEAVQREKETDRDTANAGPSSPAAATGDARSRSEASAP
jgi:hypothetical protein